MELKLQAGEFCNVQLPSGGVIQIERTLDSLDITKQTGVLYSEIQEPLLGWVESYPCNAKPPAAGTTIARELKTNETNALAEKLRHALPTTAFWVERNGWSSHYVAEDGTRVYSKMLEHNTNAKLILKISPSGQRTMIIENI